MDILIKNMELPRTLTIYPNGDIDELIAGKYVTIGKAIKLPEHGDLKDANAILRWLNAKADNRVPVTVGEIIDFIEKQPIVLEANND